MIDDSASRSIEDPSKDGNQPPSGLHASLLGVAAGLLLLFSGVPESAARDQTRLDPGPTTISSDEAAITLDPGAGVEHGVILVEELLRNEEVTCPPLPKHFG